MYKDNLFKIANSFVNFLWIVQNNVINVNDIPKAFQAIQDGENKCFANFSIPPSHAKVIFHLLHFNSSPISQIADSLGISKSNMTPIIDNLISYGLVNRFPDSDDRRILRVELTQKGYDLLNAFRIEICNLFAEKISLLSDNEITTLDESLSNLTTIFSKLKAHENK